MSTINKLTKTAPDSYTSKGKKIRRSIHHTGMWLIGNSSAINTGDEVILKMYPPDKKK